MFYFIDMYMCVQKSVEFIIENPNPSNLEDNTDPSINKQKRTSVVMGIISETVGVHEGGYDLLVEMANLDINNVRDENAYVGVEESPQMCMFGGWICVCYEVMYMYACMCLYACILYTMEGMFRIVKNVILNLE